MKDFSFLFFFTQNYVTSAATSNSNPNNILSKVDKIICDMSATEKDV